MAMGWGIMRAWGYPQVESFFVGAAMVATSVGITAQVLAAKGLLHLAEREDHPGRRSDRRHSRTDRAGDRQQRREGPGQVMEIAATAVLAIGFTIIVAKWGTQTMMRLVPHAESRLKSGEAQFNIALVLLFALSVLAMYVGVAAIIGAFLAGMALGGIRYGARSRSGAWDYRTAGAILSRRHRSAPGRDHVSRTDRYWSLALVILLAAVVSKLIGCGLGAVQLGRKEMLRIGCGMVPRGEVGMVVAQLGIKHGCD